MLADANLLEAVLDEVLPLAAPVNEADKSQLGDRLRRLRTQAGLTQATAAKGAQVSIVTWRAWEQGRQAYRPWRAVRIAQALDVPVKQLLVDHEVLIELELSPATMQDVRDRGDEAVQDALSRLNSRLAPLILQAATRPKVDGRLQRRSTRPEKLARGIAQLRALDKKPKPRRTLG